MDRIADKDYLLYVLNDTAKVTFTILFLKNGFNMKMYSEDRLIILKRLMFMTIFIIMWDYLIHKLIQSTSSILGESDEGGSVGGEFCEKD